MKTKLLSLIFAMVLTSSITTAQTKVWNFTTDRANWPDSPGIATNQAVVDNLGLFANAADAPTQIVNFAAINSSNATFPQDGYAGSVRLQLGGGGYTSANGFSNMPTQRFLHFNVSGNCTVKVWFKPGSNGTSRTVYVTNGTSTLGSATSNSGSNTDFAILTASNTAGAGKLYIFGDTASNIYKIEVIGTTVTANATLGINDFKNNSSVNVFSNGKQVHVSNVISNTKVDVYSITGALVKSFKTNSDTSFDSLNAGFYIVNVQSEEGRKVVKVAIQ